MNADKRIAIGVGALFIFTMLAGMVDAYMAAPIVKGALNQIHPNEMIVKIGAFFALIMSIGIVGISIVLYPLLKRHNETIAITYVSFRTIEGVLLIIMVTCSVLMISLSQEYINAGISDASHFQALAILVIKTKAHYAFQVGTTYST